MEREQSLVIVSLFTLRLPAGEQIANIRLRLLRLGDAPVDIMQGCGCRTLHFGQGEQGGGFAEIADLDLRFDLLNPTRLRRLTGLLAFAADALYCRTETRIGF